MLTPGVAGSVVMVIANTLYVEFLLPQKYTALILSFLLIIPIIWARYVLKAHSLSQLIAGFILPAAITLGAVFFFGWPAVP